MKKIGILTYFWDNNPGTFLQAYSTYKAFLDIFPDCQVEIIDYRPFRCTWRPSINFQSFAGLFRDWKKYIKYRDNIKYVKLSDESSRTQDASAAIDFINRQGYDLLVVGSDTVLELFRFPDDKIPPYWLFSRIDAKKVVCAASCRNASYQSLTGWQKENLAVCANSFDYLAARDLATFDLFSDLGVHPDKLEIIPDPTYCYDIDYSHVERYLSKRDIKFNGSKPVIGVHLSRFHSWNTELCKLIHKGGYDILTIKSDTRADFGCNDLSVFEWAGIFRYCTAFLTHKFHDTVFSYKNIIPSVTTVHSQDTINLNGDSKYKSVHKLYNLCKTNYISNPNDVSAEYVWEVLQNAMQTFEPDMVAGINRSNRDNYMNFVQKISGILN